MDWPRLGYYILHVVHRTTYDWTLGQILPRSREKGCQQNLTETLLKRRHGFTVRENLPEGESGLTDT